MKDPVCGMEVTQESAAAAWEHEEAVNAFRGDPEHYLGLDDSQRSM